MRARVAMLPRGQESPGPAPEETPQGRAIGDSWPVDGKQLGAAGA